MSLSPPSAWPPNLQTFSLGSCQRAGEALERVWLEVTRAGFVASLFTQVVEIAALRVELRNELRLACNRTPSCAWAGHRSRPRACAGT
jgi:hypothetical protein